jgi:hypothetical protein
MLTAIYAAYLLITILITIWVGRTLHHNGRIFLVENFRGNEAVADAVNNLLLTGFYLVNAGFICITLKYGNKPATLDEGIEFLSTKEGLIILLLGIMHFFNMCALTKYRDLPLFKDVAEEQTPASTAVPN